MKKKGEMRDDTSRRETRAAMCVFLGGGREEGKELVNKMESEKRKKGKRAKQSERDRDRIKRGKKAQSNTTSNKDGKTRYFQFFSFVLVCTKQSSSMCTPLFSLW